jgi:hypothetical protein
VELTVIFLKCEVCSKEFQRNKSEHRRSQKLGRKSFCSRSCSGTNNTKNLDEYYNNGGTRNTKNLDAANRRNEYTPFKWFLKNVKQRNKDKNRKYDIDLEYLKNLWEKQKGICPFTRWNLVLPKHGSAWNQGTDKSTKRASLDRIDNSKGYIKGNVRYVAIIANYCRNNFSDNEVKLFCEAVYKNI